MRFNSVEHLEHWKKTGQFPAIHNDIFFAVMNWGNSDKYLDLCCSFGLLGERVRKKMPGVDVYGVDADATAIQQAQDAGITMSITHMKITAETLPELVDFIREQGISGILARRAFPELFGDDLALGRHFGRQLRSVGVHEVFLEGRAPTKNAVNALSNLEQEKGLLNGSFAMLQGYNNVARMVAV
jgi:hypothetical protein